VKTLRVIIVGSVLVFLGVCVVKYSEARGPWLDKLANLVGEKHVYRYRGRRYYDWEYLKRQGYPLKDLEEMQGVSVKLYFDITIPKGVARPNRAESKGLGRDRKGPKVVEWLGIDWSMKAYHHPCIFSNREWERCCGEGKLPCRVRVFADIHNSQEGSYYVDRGTYKELVGGTRYLFAHDAIKLEEDDKAGKKEADKARESK